jgi:putative transposase
MAQYRRNWVAVGTFFFTVALANRRSGLLTAAIDVVREALRQVRAERPFEVDAMVVLPEHLHAVWTLPREDAEYAYRWRRFKTVFPREVLRRGVEVRRRDGSGVVLWQRRYWEHTIRDEVDYARHVDYIHYNPVRHGYVLAGWGRCLWSRRPRIAQERYGLRLCGLLACLVQTGFAAAEAPHRPRAVRAISMRAAC